MHHALFAAPFADLSDPAAMARLATTVEGAGWDGLYLWDHMLRPTDEVRDIADTWTMLAVVAMHTERIRLGPMVTPPVRRRVAGLVRQATTIDHLSGGRLTVGLGLGVDSGGELSRFDEVVDDRQRGDILDEAAAVLAEAWCGEHVQHVGVHLTVDGVTFSPRPVQRPRLPMWFAARGRALRPVRRAAAYEGLFHIDATPADLVRALDVVRAQRGDLDGFDVAVRVSPFDDPALLEVPGVTWAVHSCAPDVALADVLAIAAAGPGG